MFGTCIHGFISTTCPQCRGSQPIDLGDEPGSVNVDMGSIIDSTVGRIERSGLALNRAEKAQIERSFR